MTNKILETQNEEFGFWGTAFDILDDKDKTQKVWAEAFTAIREITDFTPLETLALLDSKWGRHRVDEFYTEIKQGTFAEAFRKRNTKKDLYRDYILSGEIIVEVF